MICPSAAPQASGIAIAGGGGGGGGAGDGEQGWQTSGVDQWQSRYYRQARAPGINARRTGISVATRRNNG